MSPILSGVPQGTVLGPLLFLIYINDLPTNIQFNIRLFADDCVLYRPVLYPSDSAILQSDLHLIQTWCDKWLMHLNIKKTVLLSFHRKRSHQTFRYTIFGSEVLSVSTCYLGINLTSDLSWSSHISHVSNDANRALGYIRRNLKLAPASLKTQAYLTLVRPKLVYAYAIWDPF